MNGAHDRMLRKKDSAVKLLKIDSPKRMHCTRSEDSLSNPENFTGVPKGRTVGPYPSPNNFPNSCQIPKNSVRFFIQIAIYL
jgi:hypothetical protein